MILSASALPDALRLPLTINAMSGVIALHRLLVQASPLPCSRGATAFLSLVPAENNLFPLALDALLPALQDRSLQTPQRILAAYILDALFTSHRHLNPFHDHLLHIFESEQAVAVADSRFCEPSPGSPQAGGGGLRSENEPFVWVLWKILKGEGEDLAPYSPNILSRTVLPEHLRALRLVLQDSSPDVYSNASSSPIVELSHSMYQLKTTATSPNPFDPQSSPTESMPPFTYPPTDTHVSSTTSFSPFNGAPSLGPRSTQHQSALGLTDGDTDGWLQELVPSDVYQEQGQVSAGLSRIEYAHLSSHQVPSSSPADLRFTATDDQRRQALLRALCEDPHPQAQAEIAGLLYPPVGVVETEDRYGASLGARIQHHPSEVLPTQQPQFTPFRQPHAPPQLCTPQFDIQFHPKRHDSAPTSSSLFSSVSTNVTRPPPLPIARPHPVPSLYHTSTPYAASLVPDFRLPSKLPPRQQIDDFSQQTRANELSEQSRALPANGSPPQKWKSNGVSQPSRSPGVIGSGRPSSFTSKGVGLGPVNGAGAVERRPPVGVIGNGRPPSSVIVKDACTVLTAKDASEAGRDGMVPCAVLRVEESPEGGGRRDFGAIGRPESEVQDGSEQNVGGRANGFWEATLVQALPEKVNTTVPKHQLPVIDSTSPTDHTVAKGVEPVLTLHAALEPKALSLETGPFPVLVRPPENCIGDNEADPASSAQGHSTTSPSTSPIIEPSRLKQQSETIHLPPVRVLWQKVPSTFNIDETELNTLSHAIVLLLSARERVLTLPEQRLLSPHLPMLTGPFSLLRPGDLPRLVAKNPDVAVKLLVFLLDKDDEEGAQVERVLKDVSKHNAFSLKHGPASDTLFPHVVTSIDSLAALNVIQATMEFVSSCGGLSISRSDSSEMEKILPFGGRDAREEYLNVLRELPPTMQSFSLIARLLRPSPAVIPADGTREQEETGKVRVANLVKAEVLGGFVSGCVRWIEQAEQEEREGMILDDRVAVAVSSLSRFYSSLLKHGFVSAVSEVDTTEIMSFALQFSRFEEARSLYSTLAAARA